MNAVGIDVSKGKSMVAALRPMGEVAFLPREFLHTEVGLEQMAYAILALGEDTRVIMEATGRYHEPVAAALHEYGIYVCVLNPLFIKQSGGGSIRKVKTDKADAIKIAKYGLDNWVDLREYTPMDTVRQQLKLCSRQYNLYIKTVVSLQNNLISLTDKTFPGVNELFSSPERADGHQKWVDFVSSFWHVDCVRSLGLATFTERYQKWCKRHGYNFQPEKPAQIYSFSKELISVFTKDSVTKFLVKQAVEQLNTVSFTVEQLRLEMNRLAAQLPEYQVVMAMKGVGPSLGPQLMAEIGDLSRFSHREALTAFAGVDPGVNQSGTYEARSVRTSKRGSPQLRKTLFQIMDVLIKSAPSDDAVYRFLDKKRSEGKPYYVYMTAGANKFLRIYYGRVKEYLAALPKPE
mgnify:CR=1 FL=1